MEKEMARFIISYDCGYGDYHEIIEADSEEEAQLIAYEAWKQAAESEADYDAKPYSKELAYECGLEDPDEEDA